MCIVHLWRGGLEQCSEPVSGLLHAHNRRMHAAAHRAAGAHSLLTRPVVSQVTPAQPWQGLVLKSQPRKPIFWSHSKFKTACCRYFRPVTAERQRHDTQPMHMSPSILGSILGSLAAVCTSKGVAQRSQSALDKDGTGIAVPLGAAVAGPPGKGG